MKTFARMKKRNKQFWIGLSLINLFIVALFGFLLRSKILFPLSFIGYSKFLSAHAYFALSGWTGLCLLSLLIYEVLPETLSQKSFYQWVLAGVEISSLGIALSFLLQGYGAVSGSFSLLYIAMTYVFAPVFMRDVIRGVQTKTVRLLTLAAVAFLLLSAIGPLELLYIFFSNSKDGILYRDAVYTLLHFQYNGFFTLSIVAIFFQYLQRRKVALNKAAERFALFLTMSIVPSLFLSLLWHGQSLYYIFAAVGALFILLALVQFISFCKGLRQKLIFSSPLANTFLFFSALSFFLKMLLNAGTLIPSLGNAVYGDRPVIIGFLHLVFLGFVTFFILGFLIGENHFSAAHKKTKLPFLIFALGIIANETFLMIQGLTVLFNVNSSLYNWLLWMGSLLLLLGAATIAWLFWRNKKLQNTNRVHNALLHD